MKIFEIDSTKDAARKQLMEEFKEVSFLLKNFSAFVDANKIDILRTFLKNNYTKYLDKLVIKIYRHENETLFDNLLIKYKELESKINSGLWENLS